VVITARLTQHVYAKRVTSQFEPNRGLEVFMTPLRMAATAAIALALAAPAASQPAMATYTIALDSFAYTPRPIMLAAGRPVRIVLVNRSGSGHDFTARKFFKTAQVLKGSVPEGEVELAGHATAAIELVPARGRYKVHCSHFGHKLMGMSTEIIVR